MLTDAILSGLTLGGMYALIAMGLTLQYGVARILNLAYGEAVIAASFAAYLLVTSIGIGPLAGLVLIVPVGFALSCGIYRVLLTAAGAPCAQSRRAGGRQHPRDIRPAVRRPGHDAGRLRRQLHQLFLSDIPVELLGTTVAPTGSSCSGGTSFSGGGVYLALTRTRIGTALRAVAVDPVAAGLVAIDVRWAAGLAFALGGALAATGGVLICDVSDLQRHHRRRLHHEGADRRHHGRRRRRARRADRRIDPRPRRERSSRPSSIPA